MLHTEEEIGEIILRHCDSSVVSRANDWHDLDIDHYIGDIIRLEINGGICLTKHEWKLADNFVKNFKGEIMYTKNFVVSGKCVSSSFDKLKDAVEFASRKVAKEIDLELTIYQAIKEIKAELPPVVVTDITLTIEGPK